LLFATFTLLHNIILHQKYFNNLKQHHIYSLSQEDAMVLVHEQCDEGLVKHKPNLVHGIFYKGGEYSHETKEVSF